MKCRRGWSLFRERLYFSLRIPLIVLVCIILVCLALMFPIAFSVTIVSIICLATIMYGAVMLLVGIGIATEGVKHWFKWQFIEPFKSEGDAK